MYIYIWVLLISLLFASLLEEARCRMPRTVSAGKFTVKRVYIEYLLLFMSMSPFIALCGARYDVGVDYFYTYTKIYDYVARGLSYTQVNSLWNCEMGYYLLNKIIVMMGGGYVWIFTITSALIIVLFWIAFYQQSDSICMSITLFVCAETFFITMAYVRQFIALAIVFYAFRFMKEDTVKGAVKYVFAVLLAMTFHTSAVVLLPWVVFRYIRVHPAVLTLGVLVISLLKNKLGLLLTAVLEYTPYANYIGSVYQSSSRFYSTRPIFYIAVFFIACCLYKKCSTDRNYIMMLNTAALLILITVNFDIMPQLDRITWYFETVIMLFVPYILKNINNRWMKKAAAVALITMVSVFTYHNVVACMAHGVIPYRLVFAPDAIFR